MTAWHLGPLLGFDLESTGVDVETDRIVTACVVHIDGTGATNPKPRTWLINPGVEIPNAASDIHGITTEKAKAEGRDPRDAVAEIAADLAQALEHGTPVVGFNLGEYDLNLLDHELRRHDWPDLTTMLPDGVAPIVDARVLDKEVSRRRGGRKLAEVCEFWGCALDNAHDATADAIAAARVAWKIADKHPRIARMTPPELHVAQARWKREQDLSFAAYRRSRGLPVDGLDGHFPLRPFNAQTELAS